MWDISFISNERNIDVTIFLNGKKEENYGKEIIYI